MRMFLGLWKMLRTPEGCDVFDESDSDEFTKMEDRDDLMTENESIQDSLNALNGYSEVPIVQANWNTHPLLNVAEHISDAEEDNLQVAVAEEVTEAKALDIEEVTDAIITWDESNNIKQEEDIFFDFSDNNMETVKDVIEEDQTRDNENLLINLDMDQPLKDTVEAVSLIDFGDELKQIKKETRRLIWNQKVRTRTVDSWLGFSSAPVENLQQQQNMGNNKAQIKTESYTEQLLDISTPPEKEERLTTPDQKHMLDEDETSDYESASSSHFHPTNPDSPSPTIPIGSTLTTDRDEEGKESDDDNYRATYKIYSESVVERDIRLAKEREEELRKDRLLAMANVPASADQKANVIPNPVVVVNKKLDSPNVPQDVIKITPTVNNNTNESIPMINQIANEVIPNESDTVANKIANESIPSPDKNIKESTAMLDKNGNVSIPLINSDAIKFISAVHNVPVTSYVTQKNTQRFLSSSRIQQEIEEEMRREMILRDEGVILTTSVETLDEKAAEIGEAVRGSEAVGSTSGRHHIEQGPEDPSAFPFPSEPSTPPTSPTQSVTSLSVPTIPTLVPSPPASVSSDDVPSTPSWTSSASSRRDNFANASNKLGSMDASGSNRKGIMSKFIASGGRLILTPAFSTPTPRTKQEAAPVAEKHLLQQDTPTATEPSSAALEKPVSSEHNTNKVNFKAPRWRNSSVSSAVQLRIDEELRVMKLRETELRSRRFRSNGHLSLDGSNHLVLPNSNEVDLIENEDTVTVPNSGKPRLLIAQWEEMIQQSSEC